jgi:hypothetical protein
MSERVTSSFPPRTKDRIRALSTNLVHGYSIGMQAGHGVIANGPRLQLTFALFQCPPSPPLIAGGVGLLILAFPRSALKQTFPFGTRRVHSDVLTKCVNMTTSAPVVADCTVLEVFWIILSHFISPLLNLPCFCALNHHKGFSRWSNKLL